MTQGSYKQFCPVAMAAEILCTRWTVVLLREFVAGSTRFNDLRRGVPRMSPALLSQRLKELESAGVMAFGIWGQRWVDSELSLQHLDAALLMWDMRRNLVPNPMPKRRSVVQFQYPELPPGQRSWWLVVDPNADVDLCSIDPGFDVDLYVSTDLRTMTAIWMGLDTVRAALRSERMMLTGDRQLAANIETWLGLSPFAKERKLAS